MTRDDIIRMARDAGVQDSWDLNWFDPFFERFALIAYTKGSADEREACLALCKQYMNYQVPTVECAIRARGQG